MKSNQVRKKNKYVSKIGSSLFNSEDGATLLGQSLFVIIYKNNERVLSSYLIFTYKMSYPIKAPTALAVIVQQIHKNKMDDCGKFFAVCLLSESAEQTLSKQQQQ